MGRGLEEFLRHLRLAKTYDQFRDLMSETNASTGFGGFVYAGIRPTAARRGKRKEMLDGYYHLTDISEAWIRRYTEMQHWDNDPVIRYCMGSTMPIIWDQNFAASRRTALEDRMMADAAEHGFYQGISVATHGPGAEVGILSVYSTAPAEEFRRLAEEHVNDVHLMAIHYHHAVHEALGVKEDAPVVLTKREREVMLWTTEGKTAWEIAAILTCTERTVNAHLQHAMDKMGVFSKPHAVAKFLTGTA